MKTKFVLSNCILFFSTILFVLLFSFIYGKTPGQIIQIMVFATVFSFVLVLSYIYAVKTDKLDYDNAEHPLRYMIAYCISLVFAMCFPLIDCKAWFFLSIGIVMGLLSSGLQGILSVSGLILLSVLLDEGTGDIAFMIYFLAAFVGIILYQDIDENFKVTPYAIVSFGFLFLLETAGFVFLANEELSAEQFIMPIVNLCVNALVLFLSLKYFNEKIANKYRLRYLALNDQEYKALADLKDTSKEDYYRAIHTAYLVERIAGKIGCDVYVAKNCAYYHTIKKAYHMSRKECIFFVEKNEFPPRAREVFLEYCIDGSKLDSKEASIVYVADKFVSALMNIFRNDKTATVNYKDLYDTLISKDYIVKVIEDSQLTLKDLKDIRETVLKETLYYDFLR